MIVEPQQLMVRSVRDQDHHRLVNLIHFETRVHRHLDWLAPLDWMGHDPFLIAERDGRLSAAISVPVDPPGVAWIRLFAAVSELGARQAWERMWPEALAALRQQSQPDGAPPLLVAVLPLQNWFIDLLMDSGFRKQTEVVFLTWQSTRRPPVSLNPAIHIRPMRSDDLAEVARLDTAAFAPLWRNSTISLEAALRQSAVSTIAELDGRTVGYQISTSGHMGGHLARLAVLPEAQGRGIGKALLYDLLQQFEVRGVRRLSVNTQADNPVSLHLYDKVGFQLTNEEYPVFTYPLA